MNVVQEDDLDSGVGGAARFQPNAIVVDAPDFKEQRYAPGGCPEFEFPAGICALTVPCEIYGFVHGARLFPS